MRDGASYRQKARDFEQRENWKRAIDAYELAIEADSKARRGIDPALYNRVGDLYRRVGDIAKAVYYYEKAADGHLSAGFYNDAIALCNKILRNKPNQHSAYLKLGKIGAAKGFLSDARRHLLEYAERMQRANKLDEAFSALIEFANVSSDPEIRLMIAEQLLEHERQSAAVEQLRLAWRDLRQQGHAQDAAAVRDRILEIGPDRDPEVDPPEESTVAATDSVGIMDLPEILPYDESEHESYKTDLLVLDEGSVPQCFDDIADCVKTDIARNSLEEPEAEAEDIGRKSETLLARAYHPREVVPEKWYPVLAYVLLSGVEAVVEADSRKRLGQDGIGHSAARVETTHTIARGTEVMVVPELPGCRFNPPQSSFAWLENWHCAEFRMRADPRRADFTPNRTVSGRVAFFVGPLLLAEVGIWAYLSGDTVEQASSMAGPILLDRSESYLYQAIFASYSHKDSHIVDRLQKAYGALGMQYLRDVDELRPGDSWNDALLSMIERADIFQLCWTSNAAKSPYVEREWRHALEQRRVRNFIRPVYWEEPMPDPPPQLAPF
jgi:tetratricopeptide (TPR) repeat protein